MPIAISGTRTILRSGSWFVRHGPITVIAGTSQQASGDGEVWQQSLALRDASRAHILAHCGEPDLAYESNAVSAD